MKKYLFSTLFVSSLLVSCTNEELLVTPGNGEEGEKIEVKLSASYPNFFNEANTRMELVGNSWAWVNTDMLGACKVAAIEASAATDLVSSNYPFVPVEELTTPTKNVSFKTNTAVFAGLYVFYHQYNGDLIGDGTASTNDKFNVKFPDVQIIDPAKPTAHLASQNIWVSPVIKLGGIKYNAVNETPIKLVGLNAVLKLVVKNESLDGALAINRVEVNGLNLPVSGHLEFSDNTKFPVLDPANSYADDLEDAAGDEGSMQAANSDLLAAGATATGTKISAVVTGDGVSVPADGTAEVYVLIPAGQYEINSTYASTKKAIKSISFYTSKGKFDINAEDARGGEGKGTPKSDVPFKRNSLLSLYPTLTGKGSLVESYDINGMDDWNNAVAYAKANVNQKIKFNLLTDLEISELPDCALFVDGSKKLILKSGNTYKLNANSYFSSIENNGTLSLVDNSYIGTLLNKGVVNVAATENVQGIASSNYVTWTSNKAMGINILTNQGTINLAGKMKIGANSTWTNTAVAAGVTLGTININDKADLTIGTAVTNDGMIVNKGSITLGAILTNAGTIDVTTATGRIFSTATPTGKTITNTGMITLDAPIDVFMTGGATPTVNATSFITSVGSTGTVEVAIAPAEATSSLPAIQEVNSVKMSGAWTQALLSTLNTKWDGITSQTWDAVTLDVKDLNTEFNKVTKLTINGTSAINNSTTSSVELGLIATSAATVTVNGDLTVAKNVTIGKEKATSPAITVLGSFTNNGAIYASLTVGAAQAGDIPANTTAKFTNTTDGEVNVTSAYSMSYTYDALDLYGTFINSAAKAKVNVSSVDFKVQGESTYRGEYTTK